MSKILNTQLTGIFNRIEKQAMEIQMAAQCIVQAIGGEGFVYIKGYEDLAFFEPFILQSQERLRSSRQLSTYFSAILILYSLVIALNQTISQNTYYILLTYRHRDLSSILKITIKLSNHTQWHLIIFIMIFTLKWWK